MLLTGILVRSGKVESAKSRSCVAFIAMLTGIDVNNEMTSKDTMISLGSKVNCLICVANSTLFFTEYLFRSSGVSNLVRLLDNSYVGELIPLVIGLSVMSGL